MDPSKFKLDFGFAHHKNRYMYSKTIKLLVVTVITGISGFLFLNFDRYGNDQPIDQNKTAFDYFNEDAKWYIENIPFFECSDKEIQDVYYYRWKLFKAHIRDIGRNDYVITEFIDDVSWDKDPYSSINAATVHHIYEGRWLKNNRYLDGYINYMYRGGGNDRRYSEGIADAVYARYLVNGDSTFIIKQLGIMQHIFNLWIDHYDLKKDLYFITPNQDATEYAVASIDASGEKDGWGGEAFRPTINSYMYGNALAISKIAAMVKDTLTSRLYAKKAENIRTDVLQGLWNDSLNHFMDRYKVNNKFVRYWNFIRNRELAGYLPWFYNLPDNKPKYSEAFHHLTDTTKFLGKYGLRTVEPSYPFYMKRYRINSDGTTDCQWNGPSWPYQTSQVLTAMANLLNNYTQEVVTSTDYLKILKQYTQQHYYKHGELNLIEEYDPDTGKPIVDFYRSSHYFHSSYNDLVISGLCGIRPSNSKVLIINPLIDNSIKYFCLQNVLYHGCKVTIVYDSDGSKYNIGKGVTIFVDGKKVKAKEKEGKYHVNIKPKSLKSKSQLPENIALNIYKKGYPVPTASVNSIPDSLYQAIDGRTWYFPEIKNWWTTKGSLSANDWYALDFGKTCNISTVRLSFFEDGKLYKTPNDYSIEYWDGKRWLSVKIKDKHPSSPVGNAVNAVTFHKVAANQIRIIFRNDKAKEFSTALTEIECL